MEELDDGVVRVTVSYRGPEDAPRRRRLVGAQLRAAARCPHRLQLDDGFVEFLTDELLPWVRDEVAFTGDPAETVVAGSSLGGLTAAFAALRRPDRFGLVLSQSGAFQRGLPADYALADRLPLRFYLSVGTREKMTLAGFSSIYHANLHMRDVLAARGYDVYRERRSAASPASPPDRPFRPWRPTWSRPCAWPWPPGPGPTKPSAALSAEPSQFADSHPRRDHLPAPPSAGVPSPKGHARRPGRDLVGLRSRQRRDEVARTSRRGRAEVATRSRGSV